MKKLLTLAVIITGLSSMAEASLNVDSVQWKVTAATSAPPSTSFYTLDVKVYDIPETYTESTNTYTYNGSFLKITGVSGGVPFSATTSLTYGTAYSYGSIPASSFPTGYLTAGNAILTIAYLCSDGSTSIKVISGSAYQQLYNGNGATILYRLNASEVAVDLGGSLP